MAPTSLEQKQERCRVLLREADNQLKQRNFEKARGLILEARELDSAYPYVDAMWERLLLFEKSPPHAGAKPTSGAPASRQPAPPASPHLAAVSPADLEHRLRQQIEAEYKERFTNELRKMEMGTVATHQDEQQRFAQQRAELTAHYERQIEALRRQMEEQYQERLQQELQQAEDRLSRQYESEQALVEKELKSRLTEHYKSEVLRLQQQLSQEHKDLLEKERRAYKSREEALRKEFAQRLIDVIGSPQKGVGVAPQPSSAQQQELRKKLEADLETRIAAERSHFDVEYARLKSQLEEAYKAQEAKAREEYERRIAEQLELARQSERAQYERERVKLRKEVEAEMQAKFYGELRHQREQLRLEMETSLNAEKERLRKEYDDLVAAQNQKIQQLRSEIKSKIEEEYLGRLKQVSDQYDKKLQILGSKIPNDPEEAKSFYRDRMRKNYKNGQPSVQEAKDLMELKETLGLSFEDHMKLESEVRLEMYVEAVERMIVSGELNPKQLNKLDEMKERFRITAEEATRLEPYILSSFERLALKGKILVVDDDRVLLKSLSDELSAAGFHIITCEGVDQAMKVLDTTAVDLILSDIQFPHEQLDGFKFFRLVQERPHLRKVPFVFMSSLHDGVIIRTGVQLGVDDYLTKPLDFDLLVAVMEGKLKRYRTFA